MKFKNFQTWKGSGVPEPSADGFDCGRKWLVPAFTDSHCHVLPMGLDMQALSLVEFTDREAVLTAIAERDRELEQGLWLRAVQYDQNRFPGPEHLTRAELDAINPERPILLRHSNGHASVANSAALAAANVNRDTPDPKGGTYCRDAAGELNGLLLERAHERVTATIPAPSESEMVAAITDATRAMQRFGIVRAADMMTGRWNLRQEIATYDAVAAETGFAFALYVQWADVFGPRGIEAEALREIALKSGKVHVAGIKIFADGAIGSATAAVHEPYITTGETGALIYAPDRLTSMVVTATEAGFATCVHSIGDRSTDLVLDAFEASGDPSRHRIEHVMILSDAQIERLAKLNPLVSMQPEFLTRFRTGYRNQLGPERASKLVRLKSVVDAGLRVVLNSDRPIVLGDPWVGMKCATDRPDGYDPAENIDFDHAFAMYTHLAAEACGWQGDAVAFLLYEEDPRTGHPIDPEIVWVS